MDFGRALADECEGLKKARGADDESDSESPLIHGKAEHSSLKKGLGADVEIDIEPPLCHGNAKDSKGKGEREKNRRPPLVVIADSEAGIEVRRAVDAADLRLDSPNEHQHMPRLPRGKLRALRLGSLVLPGDNSVQMPVEQLTSEKKQKNSVEESPAPIPNIANGTVTPLAKTLPQDLGSCTRGKLPEPPLGERREDITDVPAAPALVHPVPAVARTRILPEMLPAAAVRSRSSPPAPPDVRGTSPGPVAALAPEEMRPSAALAKVGRKKRQSVTFGPAEYKEFIVETKAADLAESQ